MIKTQNKILWSTVSIFIYAAKFCGLQTKLKGACANSHLEFHSEHSRHASYVNFNNLIISVNVIVKHPGLMLEQLTAIHLHCS